MTWIARIISLGALAGLTTVALILMLGQIRVLFAMSRDGLLPRVLARTGQRGTPVRTTVGVVTVGVVTVGVVTVGVGLVVGIVAAFFPIERLEQMVNVGTLFAFVLVAVVCWCSAGPDRSCLAGSGLRWCPWYQCWRSCAACG